MIQLGERVLVHSVTLAEPKEGNKQARPPMPGRVVYIHPKGRFCTVEMDGPRMGGPVRESFLLESGELVG